ncbi:hypothetical protein [Hymenobacter antarcticus]|uniref:hypothetical protein n=1 Tax=Hymenobacter antarcticus TaxID=486270 RepID=UPI0031F044E5
MNLKQIFVFSMLRGNATNCRQATAKPDNLTLTSPFSQAGPSLAQAYHWANFIRQPGTTGQTANGAQPLNPNCLQP